VARQGVVNVEAGASVRRGGSIRLAVLFFVRTAAWRIEMLHAGNFSVTRALHVPTPLDQSTGHEE
jgi:hypothetical protein